MEKRAADKVAEKAFRIFGKMDRERIDDRCRAILVVKARWLFLVLLFSYSLAVIGGAIASSWSIDLSTGQKIVFSILFLVAVSSNALFHQLSLVREDAACPSTAQVIIDLVMVTLIVHLTGGAGSWLWPMYILVTIEAVFLFDRIVTVWLFGALGSIIYGGLLLLEQTGLLHHAGMPYVHPSVHTDFFYIFLLWGWVALLNTAVAVIATYLMSVIRTEAEAVRQSEERLLHFIDTTSDMIQSTSLDGKFLYVNRTWSQILGYSLEELAGKTLYDLVPEEQRPLLAEQIRGIVSHSGKNFVETILHARDGHPVEVEGTLTVGLGESDDSSVIWGITRDVTERKEIQRQLYRLAHFDPLTGLANRVLFYERVRHTRAIAQRNRRLMALAFIDLDRFKVINDTLGHPVGDELLRMVGERLSNTVREVDTVARIGGDEFIVILGDLRNRSDSEMVVSKLLAGMADPFTVQGHELFISCSIGVSIYPDDDEDMDNLMKKADLAMYTAKAKGKSNFCYYSSEMDEHAHRRFVLENGMRRAIERQEFLLYYQPKIDILSGQVTSLEALLRWNHPELGLLSPTEFIPLAEESGLIIPLGEWVLREACLQNRRWQEDEVCTLRVAVNVSGYQLQSPAFADTVARILEETGLSPEFLELEITETVIMQHPEFTVGILERFREMGIHISIDDFGTGYSSLAHLKRFSVNALKIDKSFVSDIDRNETDAAIAHAIVTMGSSLNLKVIAEGVERQAQFTILQGTRCDEVQGYLISRPIPSEEVGRFIREMEAKRSGGKPFEIVTENGPVVETEG
ncbi:MAG: EAL domain-containing protein [Desulfuromonadia bacterium]